MLVGILPGPNEPHLTLNSSLDAFEGQIAIGMNNGMEITVDTAEGLKASYTVYLALVCVACDITAVY